MSDYKSKNRIIIDLIRNLIVGLAILLFGFYFWQHFAGNPINELRLVMDADIAEGYITKAEEFSDYVEENDGRSGRMAYEYYYTYYFITKDGKRIEDQAKCGGKLPEELCCIDSEPYKVKVEYIPRNPKINRVKGHNSGTESFGEWFWRKFLLGGLLLIVSLSIGFIYIRSTVKQYREQLKLKNKTNSD